MRLKARQWLRGLIGGIVGGGANAALASLSLAGAHAVGVDVRPLDFEQVGVVFLSGSVIGLLLYLKQSPIPPEDDPLPPDPAARHPLGRLPLPLLAVAGLVASLCCGSGCGMGGLG